MIIDDTHRSEILDLIDKISINMKFVEFEYLDSSNKIRVYYKNEYEDYILKMSKEITSLSNEKLFKIITF